MSSDRRSCTTFGVPLAAFIELLASLIVSFDFLVARVIEKRSK